jgi:addiction module RelE/StbE family toxin
MRVVYSKVALKQLKRLPKGKQVKVLKRIEQLKENPQAGKKLKGKFRQLWSLKIWPYRVIYRYFSRKRIVFINVVQHRQAVYK